MHWFIIHVKINSHSTKKVPDPLYVLTLIQPGSEPLETLIRLQPIPLASGMPKMPQYSLICQPGISSCPGDAGEIWGSRATKQRAQRYASDWRSLLVTAQTPVWILARIFLIVGFKEMLASGSWPHDVRLVVQWWNWQLLFYLLFI